MNELMENIKIKTNCYELYFKRKIFKYVFQIKDTFETELTTKMIIKAIQKNYDILKEKFTQNFIFFNNSIYSPRVVENFNINLEMDNIKFKIKIFQNGKLDDEEIEKKKLFMGRLMNYFLIKFKYIKINKKYFNNLKSKHLTNGIDIWPGFNTSIILENSNKLLLNIDLSFKIITNRKVSNIIYKFMKKNMETYEIKSKQNLIGTTVMTKYNRFFYKIDDIDFESSPLDSFYTYDNKKTTYIEYYKNKYDEEIKDPNQPLLIHIKKNKKLYLIPELCITTGLNENDKNNNNLKYEINKITNLKTIDRIKKSLKLNEEIKLKGKEFLEDYNIYLDDNSYKFKCNQIKPVKFLMKEKNIDLSKNINIDKELQSKMYTSRTLNKIAVFFSKYQDFNILNNCLKNALNIFKIKWEEIIQFKIDNSYKFENWKNQIEKLDLEYELCIFILDIDKKKGKFYSKIKNLMTNNYPIPSQMILTSKINNNKILLSIILKIIIQINSKIGEIPWVIDNDLFIDKYILISGITKGKLLLNGEKGIYICSTIENNFGKYYSKNIFFKYKNSEDYDPYVSKLIYKSLKQFYLKNKKYPYYYILYIDNFKSYKKKQLNNFIESVKIGLEMINKDKNNENEKKIINLIILNAKKCYNIRVYNDDNLNNKISGTVILDNLVKSWKEFYLISPDEIKGIINPINYEILYENWTINNIISEKNLQKKLSILTYKLCFMYFNTPKPTKLPAPLVYSNLFCRFIEKNTNDKKIIPHKLFDLNKGLYFI